MRTVSHPRSAAVPSRDKSLTRASLCHSCKKLAPIYDTLGEEFSNVKDKLVIAKFDATENDVPSSAGFRVTGFPTLKFKAAGTDEWISYEGDRSLESLREFLETNATNDILSPDDAEAELEGETEVKSGRHDELVRSACPSRSALLVWRTNADVAASSTVSGRVGKPVQRKGRKEEWDCRFA